MSKTSNNAKGEALKAFMKERKYNKTEDQKVFLGIDVKNVIVKENNIIEPKFKITV